MKMKLLTTVACAALALGAQTQVQAVTYTSNTNLSAFTSGVSEYATFTNCGSLSGDLGCAAPSITTIDFGQRVYGNNLSPAIFTEFSSATNSIRVFANMDHLGSPYDGYQYTIFGSNDGSSYTGLFDALTVDGSGEPFTLGTFTGTAPTTVNNIVVGTGGGQGITGYIADFTFSTAYKYYMFGASTVAINQGNADQELSAVGMISSPVPEPETYTMLLAGLAFLGYMARRRKHNFIA